MKLSTALNSSLLCVSLLLAAGCSKKADSNTNYESAINDYYKAHPACIWQDTKKFPVQAATADDAKTEGFDALTDANAMEAIAGGRGPQIRIATMYGIIVHANEVYGAMGVYMRAKGIVPPSSEGR